MAGGQVSGVLARTEPEASGAQTMGWSPAVRALGADTEASTQPLSSKT
jgi:hypothetical protein